MTTPAPSVPNFIAGFGAQQADMQSLWVNAAAFFQQRVIFRATQTTTATTLPSSSAITSIAYDNIIEDPYSGWNGTNKNWSAPFTGWYQVNVTVWTAAAALQVAVAPYVFTSNASGNQTNGQALTVIVIPAAGGAAEGTWYIYLYSGNAVAGAGAVFNSGANVLTSLVAGQQSSMEIVWIGS